MQVMKKIMSQQALLGKLISSSYYGREFSQLAGGKSLLCGPRRLGCIVIKKVI